MYNTLSLIAECIIMFDAKKYKAEYYKKNKEKILKKSKETYKKNASIIKEKRLKKRKQETKEERLDRLAYHRAYNKKHRKKQSERMASVEYRYEYYYKRNASQRGYGFNLTFTQFKKMFEANCVYCGVSPSRGVDRVDNAESYTTENCVPCCSICNKMKWSLRKEDFINQATRIAKHNHMV